MVWVDQMIMQVSSKRILTTRAQQFAHRARLITMSSAVATA